MGFFDALIYKKYNIIEKQLAAQANDRLVHLKGAHRPTFIRGFQATFAFTAAYAVYGISQLILGKKD